MILGGERLDLAADGGRLLSPLPAGTSAQRAAAKTQTDRTVNFAIMQTAPNHWAKAQTSDRYDFRLIPSHPGVWPDLCCNPRQPQGNTTGGALPGAPNLPRPALVALIRRFTLAPSPEDGRRRMLA